MSSFFFNALGCPIFTLAKSIDSPGMPPGILSGGWIFLGNAPRQDESMIESSTLLDRILQLNHNYFKMLSKQYNGVFLFPSCPKSKNNCGTSFQVGTIVE
jgi:hypothetical protein